MQIEKSFVNVIIKIKLYQKRDIFIIITFGFLNYLLSWCTCNYSLSFKYRCSERQY